MKSIFRLGVVLMIVACIIEAIVLGARLSSYHPSTPYPFFVEKHHER